MALGINPITAQSTDVGSSKFVCSKGHEFTMCFSRYHNGDIRDECYECGEVLGTRYRSYPEAIKGFERE